MTRRSTHLVLAATSVLSLGLWTGCGDNQSTAPQSGSEAIPAPAVSDGELVSGDAATEPNGTNNSNEVGNNAGSNQVGKGQAGSNQASQTAAQEQVSPTPEASPIEVEPTPIIVVPTATPIIIIPTPTVAPTVAPTAAPTVAPTATPTASPSATPRRHDRDHDRDRDRDRNRDHDRDRDHGRDRDRDGQGDDWGGDEDHIMGSSASSQLQFPPQAIQIRAGEKVVWTNNGSVAYTVTADPNMVMNRSDVSLPDGAEPFSSGEIAPGQRFSKTFKVPGTYKYFSKTAEGTGTVSTITVAP